MRTGLLAALCISTAGVVAVAMRMPATPAASPAAMAPIPAVDSYTVDSVHSFVTFKIKHLGVSYAFGRFNDMTGSFSVDGSGGPGVAFDVKVKSESIDTGNEKRDAHLKSPDFFNVRQFPELAFKSTRVEAAGTNSYNVTGDLAMHGVTKPVTIKMNFVGAANAMGANRAGYETTFTIKRSDFGMDYMLEGLGDEVTVMVSLEGTR